MGYTSDRSGTVDIFELLLWEVSKSIVSLRLSFYQFFNELFPALTSRWFLERLQKEQDGCLAHTKAKDVGETGILQKPITILS